MTMPSNPDETTVYDWRGALDFGDALVRVDRLERPRVDLPGQVRVVVFGEHEAGRGELHIDMRRDQLRGLIDQLDRLERYDRGIG